MQTLSSYGAKANRVVCEFDGLSTDSKPTVSFTEPNTNVTMYIDNGSIFNEIDTGKTYKYDKSTDTWIMVSGGGSGGSAVLIDKTITANGEYNASDDSADGYSSVDVTVSAIGTPKLVTPTALATIVNRGITFIQSLNDKKTNVELSPMCCNINGPSSYGIYTVCTTPINSVTFKFCPLNREGYSDGGEIYILFVASSNTFTGYYYDQNFSKETINSTSVTAGKTYKATFIAQYRGSATSLDFDFDDITEYNESITFTVE